uniref:Uncharacterized protein n=1 Tax=Physcomitrium patens TaxID=3218 RepID=A0A7I4A393_PHYPA
VGYFLEDTVRHVENKKLPVSLAREDLRDLSDVHSGLYNDVMSFHHVTKMILRISSAVTCLLMGPVFSMINRLLAIIETLTRRIQHDLVEGEQEC